MGINAASTGSDIIDMANKTQMLQNIKFILPRAISYYEKISAINSIKLKYCFFNSHNANCTHVFHQRMNLDCLRWYDLPPADEAEKIEWTTDD